MNKYLKKLSSVAKSYSRYIKTAFDANEDKVKVKRMAEAVLNKLADEDGGEGILYPSNVSIQKSVDKVHVSFIVNLDTAYNETLLENKGKRDSKIQEEMLPQLRKLFGGLPVTLMTNDAWVEDPGFFSKKFE